jgi:hypothetical protein
VNIFDVIQIIENGRLTGALALKLPSIKGEIRFNEGQVVDACSASAAGIKALDSFLGASDGTFQFVRSSSEYPRIIEASSNSALLLDMLRARGGT